MKISFVYINSQSNVGRGAGYVAGAVVRAGHELTFFDNYLLPVSEIAKKIEINPPDIVMISSMTILFHQALELIRIIKKKHPHYLYLSEESIPPSWEKVFWKNMARSTISV